MKLDLENLNPGTWFDLPDGGRICLRTLSQEEAAEIDRATVKKSAEYKGPHRYQIIETDELKRSDMVWERCIVDWEGIEAGDGKPLECTPDLKKRLMRKSPAFARMVMGFLAKLAEVEQADAETELKN